VAGVLSQCASTTWEPALDALLMPLGCTPAGFLHATATVAPLLCFVSQTQHRRRRLACLCTTVASLHITGRSKAASSSSFTVSLSIAAPARSGAGPGHCHFFTISPPAPPLLQSLQHLSAAHVQNSPLGLSALCYGRPPAVPRSCLCVPKPETQSAPSTGMSSPTPTAKTFLRQHRRLSVTLL
jgi:hypothetical protein